MGQGPSTCCLAQDKEGAEAPTPPKPVIAEAEPRFPEPRTPEADMARVEAALAAVTESIARLTQEASPDARDEPAEALAAAAARIAKLEAELGSGARSEEARLTAALQAATDRIAMLEAELLGAVDAGAARGRPLAGTPGSVKALAKDFDAAAKVAEARRSSGTPRRSGAGFYHTPRGWRLTADGRSPRVRGGPTPRGSGRGTRPATPGGSPRPPSPLTLAQMTFVGESHGHSRRHAVRGIGEWGRSPPWSARASRPGRVASPGKENEPRGGKERRTTGSTPQADVHPKGTVLGAVPSDFAPLGTHVPVIPSLELDAPWFQEFCERYDTRA